MTTFDHVLPDCIVQQLLDEAAQAGDARLVTICERVLAYDIASSDEEDADQYREDLRAIHTALADARAMGGT